jgi:xyloglucan-specific exo-beta-1,4-glucanase
MRPLLLTIALLTVFSGLSIAEEPVEAYNWNRVAIGGGGYVTGLAVHPTEPNLVYFRTDNGGAYRWNSPTESWIWITEQWTAIDKNYYGIDGLALDPSHPDVVYIAAGKNLGDRGAIFKSTDRGGSWRKLKDVAFAGNGNLRWAGEPIAVDPNNSSIIYVGTRKDGLLRTDDGGLTWATVTAVPKGEVGIGIRTVAIAPIHHGNDKSPRIYVSVYGVGIYANTDGESSWHLLRGSPTQPRRMKISTNGKLFVTAGDGVFCYNGATWEEISPSQDAFAALDVASDDPNRVIVAVDFYGSKHVGPMKIPIYLSVNGGRSWTEIVSRSKWAFAAPWYSNTRFSAATADLKFDPQHTKRVWIADWYQVMVTENIDASTVLWVQKLSGHEQSSTLALSAPPVGAPLISGLADNRGFRHLSLDSYPDAAQNVSMETTGVDFCESNPNALFEVGGDRDGVAAYSVDNGASWVKTSWPFGGNGKVAISASDPNLIVVVPRDRSPKRSINRGSTWEDTSGAPAGGVADFWSGQIPIAADRVVGNTFYYLSATGDFYRSVDGGAKWTKVSEIAVQAGYMVKTAPGIGSAVWVSAVADGIYRSSDGGTTFSKVANVDQALLFGFGKNQIDRANPTVFLYGRIRGVDGIYRSDDMGESWKTINDRNAIVGINPKAMEGDRQVVGRVYIGTGGGGIFYGTPN